MHFILEENARHIYNRHNLHRACFWSFSFKSLHSPHWLNTSSAWKIGRSVHQVGEILHNITVHIYIKSVDGSVIRSRLQMQVVRFSSIWILSWQRTHLLFLASWTSFNFDDEDDIGEFLDSVECVSIDGKMIMMMLMMLIMILMGVMVVMMLMRQMIRMMMMMIVTMKEKATCWVPETVRRKFSLKLSRLWIVDFSHKTLHLFAFLSEKLISLTKHSIFMLFAFFLSFCPKGWFLSQNTPVFCLFVWTDDFSH